jgi:UDP:flavonoid glycosyltransferase YjiC (YdhE family)
VVIEAACRLLFVPVSGPAGMGEYARALAMANAARSLRPETQIRFLLSREAPYAAAAPFPSVLLPSSPTFHSSEVIDVIRVFAPTTVIFDNAGRTAQLRAAHQSGARVIFVSARARQRSKAFRLRWMRLVDEHWIAYPRLIAGGPDFFERLKLSVMARPRLRFLDPLLPPHDDSRAAALWGRFGLRSGEYVVVVPGGGTEHAGSRATLDAFAQAASQIAAQGVATVLVGLGQRENAPDKSRLRTTERLPLDDLMELMLGARLVITNGGYTLLQALACDRPCIAVALVADQVHRIDRCIEAGIALRGAPTAEALARASLDLLSDSAALNALRLARSRVSIRNGSETVARALTGSGG